MTDTPSTASSTTVPASVPEVPPASPFMSVAPILMIGLVMYFMLIRPQQRRFKEQQAMIAAIKKGDKVLVGGGIYGVVAKIESDNDLSVEIASGMTVKVARSTVTVLTEKPAPTLAAKAVEAKKAKAANDNC